METMKVETIAKEIIKPSSTTPNDLQTLQLSIYDHILPPVYTVAFLFYTKDDLISPEQSSHKLKTSLAETLTKFYPLAGRIKGVTIDCNDEGAVFVDARVNNYPLSDFLRSPDFKTLQQLLPLDVIDDPYEAATTWPLLLVKATYFPCGGMAIGLCITHKIADATSISTFIQSWAAMARGEAGDIVADPVFAAANFYPPANELFKFPVDENANKISQITKRFVFSASKLEELRTKAASEDFVGRPKRVESVTALLWKAFVAAASSNTNACDMKVLIQPSNLRPKIPSLLAESLIGNIMFSSVVLGISQQEEIKIEKAVRDLRKQGDDLQNVIKEEGGSSSAMIGSKLANLMLTNYSKLSYETHEPYTVSSWCKLPLYEASFGWGSPVWIAGNVAPMLENVTMLIDSKDGQGIEAFVTLPEENMLSLEQNTELLAFASVNPSVLV
ncbi:acetyl-CoA:benzylalcohol acetyltranferase-like protein [Arabidopsis thaliana]|uniref:Acetyl-CoA:benzylalcohol acetyltranferase-like protein n=1 Tax=Arabidopsis thaliana TaxID=3702 RepID=Q9LI71_ARATH|nr:HXXXD-type acyl-transferase family protein [Arabidopsis thaliana]AEE77629.1 HXXXD-type acyl-transferase family protein [Arabidopsis thaliana]BAB02229.1 acetyl-CoA:benzylalcohol acetyltranferase-like protein [Arabidopsis thaliana]|eukprot:NP_189647.1 HXXXD-type acyl-transferase family protein [Arabidopsis thaliana]